MRRVVAFWIFDAVDVCDEASSVASPSTARVEAASAINHSRKARIFSIFGGRG
jgi:hypothetical protein